MDTLQNDKIYHRRSGRQLKLEEEPIEDDEEAKEVDNDGL